MLKTLKRISAGSLLGCAFLLSPLDTPVHKIVNPFKIQLYESLRPSLFNFLGPNMTYNLELFLLSCDFLVSPQVEMNSILTLTLPDGRKLPNPICLAAGYDKEGKALESLFKLGFGSVEIGSLTIDNEHQNLRLKVDMEKGIVKGESYGESPGILMAKSNLHSYFRKIFEKRDNQKNNIDNEFGENRLVGINVMPDIETQENAPYLADSEFEQCAREVAEYADYLLLNISDGRTAAISQYKSERRLRELIKKVKGIRTLEIGFQAAFDYETKSLLKNKVIDTSDLENNTFHTVYNHYDRNNPLSKNKTPLLFVKIDANSTKDELISLSKVALEEGLDGIVVGSCSTAKSSELNSRNDFQKELIGGKPNKERANEALKLIYQLTKGRLILVSSGGVFDAKDVLDRIKNGANLVQIYSSFLLNGPYMVSHLIQDLSKETIQELKVNNVKNINGLVGIQAISKIKSSY